MYAMGFIEAFIELYNVNAAVAIIILCGRILFKTRKMDRGLMKARLFLDDAIMQRTWMYISIAGASFALNALIRLVVKFTALGAVLNIQYMIELTQIIFLIAFILAIYSWYLFISTHIQVVKLDDLTGLKSE